MSDSLDSLSFRLERPRHSSDPEGLDMISPRKSEPRSDVYAGPASLSRREVLGADSADSPLVELAASAHRMRMWAEDARDRCPHVGPASTNEGFGRPGASKIQSSSHLQMRDEEEDEDENEEEEETEGEAVYDRSSVVAKWGPDGSVLELIEIEIKVLGPIRTDEKAEMRLRLLLPSLVAAAANLTPNAIVEVISVAASKQPALSSRLRSARTHARRPLSVLVGVWLQGGEPLVLSFLHSISTQSLMAALNAATGQGINSEAGLELGFVRVVEEVGEENQWA